MSSTTNTTSTQRRALGEPSDRASAARGRVVVTGGSGKLGRATVQHLSENGYEVINFDVRRPPGAAEDGKTGLNGAYKLVEIDLTDMGQVLESLMEIDMAYAGVDAIVHLAAMPSPGQSGSARQFMNNFSSTYNILEAARKLNITNLVLASSETLIGIPLIEHPSQLPITEDTPRSPQSAYSLSKLMGEHLADQYATWCPQSKYVSLRFSNVMLEAEYPSFEAWQDDPTLRFWNCWGYIDARDGADAILRSLLVQLTGHHQFLIANANTCMRTPNADLVSAVFPNTPYRPIHPDEPNETLLSIEKAKRELGWVPKYNWK